MDSAIDVHHLSVKFGSEVVLRDINFSLGRGEVVAVIGPNGSGKSTLLQAILGLIPYSGSIHVFGAPMSTVLHRIGYVPQRFTFDRTFPLTVGEFLRLSKVTPKHSHWREAVLAEVGLTGSESRRVGELSGGELQRLLIANALMGEPELLLLDEPTSNIDVAGERGFYDLVDHLHRHHQITVLMVSHDLGLVAERATKVLGLNRELVYMGSPQGASSPDVTARLYGRMSPSKPQHYH